MLPRKNSLKLLPIIVALFSSLLIPLFLSGNAWAQSPYDELAVQALRNNYELHQGGQPVDSGWGNFSSYDAYILNQAGADVGSWVYDDKSFKDRVIILIDETIAKESTAGPSSSKRVAQDYLGAKAMRENVKATQLLAILQSRQIAAGNGSFDNEGFSDIAAFEMIGRAGDIDLIDTADAIAYILEQQHTPSGAWTGGWQDFMTTAEGVRALKYLEPYAGEQGAAVSAAINSGCNWLRTMQQENGGFCDGGGFDDPAIDTAEIIYTQKLLGIEFSAWSNSDKSAVDYLQNTALNTDRSFGTGKNAASNIWVLDAYLKMGASPHSNTVLGLMIEPSSANITLNDSHQFISKAYTLGGSLTDVTSTSSWSAQDADVASVKSGLIQGLKAGQTTISSVFHCVWGSAVITIVNSGSSSGQEPGNNINVYMAVVGESGNLLYGPGMVTITSNNADDKGTGMDALQATGLTIGVSDIWDGFIIEIDGVANEGTKGWMWSINGNSASDVPKKVSIMQDDEIIFWYSTSTGSRGPSWAEVLALANGLSSTKIINQAEEEVKATLNRYSSELAGLLDLDQATSKLLNVDNRMSKADAENLKIELSDNTVDISGAVGEKESVLGDQELSMLIPENALAQTINLSAKELSAQDSPQQANIKLGSSIYEFGPGGTRFAKPITIAIKVAITEDMNIENLSPACYDEQNKEWIPIPGVIDLKMGMAVFQIDHFSKFALVELIQPILVHNRITFADVDEDIAWARDAIEILAGRGVIKGTDKGFEPQRAISRAELVKMVTTALEMETVYYKNGLFNDVTAADWYGDSVATAYENQIIFGYPEGSFKPNNNISRNEAAGIFYYLDVAKNNIDNVKPIFKDMDSIPDWAANGVKYVYKQGIMQGNEEGYFNGTNPLSRAEGAVVIYKYLQSINEI
ncbi:MAG: S-layer homology domain-containing protein [Syntrophomonas sp.]|nr:S-layer homology domain-containing protein [Syntrophomonas sp.]